MFSWGFWSGWSWFTRPIAAISEGAIGMIVEIILVIGILFVGWKIIIPNEWWEWRPSTDVCGYHRCTVCHTHRSRSWDTIRFNILRLAGVDDNRLQALSFCCWKSCFLLPTFLLPPTKYFIFGLFLGYEVEMVAVVLSDQVPLRIFAEELQKNSHTQPLHPELTPVNCSP